MILGTPGLADQILAAWRVADTRGHVTDYPCGVPDKGDIEKLVEVAFYASIEREEGAFITFSLMLLQTHKDSKPRHRLSEINRFLPFATPAKLSVQTVRKLAGAVDERTSSLVVEKRAGHLVLTGIAPFGRQTSRLTAAIGGYPRPEALTVGVRGPGSLLLSWAGSNLGRFAAGEFQTAQVTPFHSRALGAHLIACISQHEAFARFENSYWHWYHDTLEHLLRSTSAEAMVDRLSGCRSRNAPLRSSRSALAFQFAGLRRPTMLSSTSWRTPGLSSKTSTPWSGRGMQLESGTANQVLSLAMGTPDLKYRLTTILNTLARIACIDGATLYWRLLRAAYLGGRLSAAEWKGPIRLGPTATAGPGEAVARDRFGTRHNSAIDFVAAVPGSVAFVLSQDGPVRAITCRDDTVFLWPDCLNTMFLD